MRAGPQKASPPRATGGAQGMGGTDSTKGSTEKARQRHPWIEVRRLVCAPEIYDQDDPLTVDWDWVRVLAERYMAGVEPPPIVVFREDETYWLADGLHRVLAVDRAGRCTIDVDLRAGSRREAKLFWVSRIDQTVPDAIPPGCLQLTMRDLEHQVRTLLREFPEKRIEQIARHVGVSVALVKQVKREAGPGQTELFGSNANATAATARA